MLKFFVYLGARREYYFDKRIVQIDGDEDEECIFNCGL